MAFDASAIAGFGDVARSDLFLVPDLTPSPCCPGGPARACVGRVFCNITYPDGRPFEGDGRICCGPAGTGARAPGLRAFWWARSASFICSRRTKRAAPPARPFDRAGYFDMAPLDQGENVRRRDLPDAGGDGHPARAQPPRAGSRPERDRFPLRVAPGRGRRPDGHAHGRQGHRRRKRAVRLVPPKPLPNESGSGLHINLSLFLRRAQPVRGLLPDPDPARPPRSWRAFCGAAEITVFANPLPGSYARLGALRSARHGELVAPQPLLLVRVPAASGPDCRMELRSPDPSCNPYFATLLLLARGSRACWRGWRCPRPRTAICLPARAGRRAAAGLAGTRRWALRGKASFCAARCRKSCWRLTLPKAGGG